MLGRPTKARKVWREHVEAARSLGAGRMYILFRELLPNLVAPITVYATLMIPTNVR